MSARLPNEWETPTALLRALFPIIRGKHDPLSLVWIFNAASCPWLLRGNDEARDCNRIARLCGRIRALRYTGIDCYGRSNGAWSVVVR